MPNHKKEWTKLRRTERYEQWMCYFKHIRWTSEGNARTVTVPVKHLKLLELLKHDMLSAEINYEKPNKNNPYIEVHMQW